MRYSDIAGVEEGGLDENGRKNRQMPLGFPTTALAAGASQNITATTQVLFRGRRLIIPADIAPSLLINDLKVGKNSQLPSSGPIPGQVFSEDAVGVDLSLDPAKLSQTVTINVTNTSLGPITFNATMLGDSQE